MREIYENKQFPPDLILHYAEEFPLLKCMHGNIFLRIQYTER